MLFNHIQIELLILIHPELHNKSFDDPEGTAKVIK